MNKYFIATIITASLSIPLFASAESATTTASTTPVVIATTTPVIITGTSTASTTPVMQNKICITTANKKNQDTKAAAKVIYDTAKAAAMKVRTDAVTAARALPVASSTEKTALIKNIAATYKTSIVSATKALESARKVAQSTHKTEIASCASNLKAAKKSESERKLNEKKREEVKTVRTEVKSKVEEARLEGKKKMEELRNNKKATTTRQ